MSIEHICKYEIVGINHDQCKVCGTSRTWSPSAKPDVSPCDGAAASSGNSVEQDAERYRWLRAENPASTALFRQCIADGALVYEAFDRAVDAAIAAGAGTPGPAGTGELAGTCAVCTGSGYLTVYNDGVIGGTAPCPSCSGRSPTTRG